MKKVLIIIPTYNEVDNITSVINQVFEQQKYTNIWDIHILIVDSYSNDGTANKVRIIQKRNHKLHLLETKKEGLGKAYVAGFAFAMERLQAYAVFEMDADLSHNPNMIPKFLKHIEYGADFVIGSRYIKGGSIPQNWGIHRKFLSYFGNIIFRLGFFKLSINDWTSGYRALKMWIVKDAFDHIKSYSGYVFQVAFLDYAIKNRAKIVEEPIQFVDRIAGKSKINAVQYIISSLLYVFLNSSFIKFAFVGVIGFGIDFGLSYLGIEILHKSIWIATFVSTEIAILSNFLLNNFWSFAHKKLSNGFKSYLLSFLKFNLVSSGSILIQVLGVSSLAHFFGATWWPIYKVGIIAFVIIPYSYILYNKFVWKEKK